MPKGQAGGNLSRRFSSRRPAPKAGNDTPTKIGRNGAIWYTILQTVSIDKPKLEGGMPENGTCGEACWFAKANSPCLCVCEGANHSKGSPGADFQTAAVVSPEHLAWHPTRALYVRLTWYELNERSHTTHQKRSFIKAGHYCELCGDIRVDRAVIHRALRTESDRKTTRSRP